MTRAADDIALALIAICIGLSSCLSCSAEPALAQVPARLAAGASREAAAVTLARFVAGESDGRKPEVAPLLWTMRHRAEAHGVSLVAMVRAYSSPLRGFGGDRGAWVRALPVLPTRGYRVPWWTSFDGVRSFLAGTLPDPCRRPALHFGSVADMRARFPNAVPIDCGVPPGGNVFITESGI